MSTETITVEADQLTVDHLVWRRFRQNLPGLVEQVLALNPGLAQLGPYLPRGAKVVVPILQPAETRPAAKVITLWD